MFTRRPVISAIVNQTRYFQSISQSFSPVIHSTHRRFTSKHPTHSHNHDPSKKQQTNKSIYLNPDLDLEVSSPPKTEHDQEIAQSILAEQAINEIIPPIHQTTKQKVGIVMLNMGGPATIGDVKPFLERLFADGEIIQFGRLQPILGPFVARRRTRKIERQYGMIGGSPIRRWTEAQAAGMVEYLKELDPSNEYVAYPMFRYADPLTGDVLKEMAKQGINRAIAFSQYPQFSCATTGSSLNHLWRSLIEHGFQRQFRWSLIDRWHTHPLFIEAVADRVLQGLQRFNSAMKDHAVIMFSAHSLPMRVVNRGDSYSGEVAATVDRVMELLRRKHGIDNAHMLCWQSQVGFLPWLGPQTGQAIEGLAKQGHKHLLVVPIAFTSDHVETLYELDIEYKHVADKAGVLEFHRAESLNAGEPTVKAMAHMIHEHVQSEQLCSPQYKLNCAHCENPICRSIINPIKPFHKLRDQVNPTGELYHHATAQFGHVEHEPHATHQHQHHDQQHKH